jgi:hypothetical protein
MQLNKVSQTQNIAKAAAGDITGFAYTDKYVYIQCTDTYFVFDTSGSGAPRPVQDPDISGVTTNAVPWSDNDFLRMNGSTLELYKYTNGHAEKINEVTPDTEGQTVVFGTIAASPEYNTIVIPMTYPEGNAVTGERIYKFSIYSYNEFDGFVSRGTLSNQVYGRNVVPESITAAGYIYTCVGGAVKSAPAYGTAEPVSHVE